MIEITRDGPGSENILVKQRTAKGAWTNYCKNGIVLLTTIYIITTRRREYNDPTTRLRPYEKRGITRA